MAPAKIVKYFLVTLFVLIFYVMTSVPLGLFIYSWKTDNGLNFFSKTGFHSYMSCLAQEAKKAKLRDLSEYEKEMEKEDRR